MLDLKANTETIVTIGPFVDRTDGYTPETGVTLGAADEAELIKHGSTSVVDLSAATWAAVTGSDGHYSLTLTASHLDTEGQLTIVVQDDDVCLPVKNTFRVLSEAAYDSMYAPKDTGYMDVDVTAVSTSTTAANNMEVVFDTDFATNYNGTRDAWVTNAQDFVGTTASDPFNGQVVAASVTGAVGSVTSGVTLANGAITDASLAGNMEIVFETDFLTNYNATRSAWVTNAQDFVGTTAADPFNGQVVAASVTGHTNQTGDSYARLGAPAGASVSADIAAVKVDTAATLVDTAEIGAAGAGLSAIPWNAAWDAEVESEVNDALDTAISELGVAAPTATPTIRTGLMLLYMALRNKTVVQTSGTDALEVYNNAGTIICKKLLTDDTADYTEAQMTSG